MAFCDKLNQSRTKMEIPLRIFISSGYPEDETRKLSPNGSIAGFLEKPYTGTVLAGKIAQPPKSR